MTTISPCPERDRVPSDPAKRQLWNDLTAILLKHGGTKTKWSGCDPYLENILRDGTLFEQPVRQTRGEPCHCHFNSAALWAKNIKNTQIVTGYGLSLRTGTWDNHSWILKGRYLIETTETRDKYFGIVLQPFEALRFWFANDSSLEHPHGIPDDKIKQAASPELVSLMSEYMNSCGYFVIPTVLPTKKDER